MSFKSILILFSLICLTACGVKSKPFSPPETAIDSYLKSYTDPEETNQNKSPTPAVKK